MNDDGKPAPTNFQTLTELDDAWRATSAGERYEAVRRGARDLRDRIGASGEAVCVRTFDNSVLPYPTRFGFGGAAVSPLPYLAMTNRVNVVQFETAAGETKTLLFNPTDVVRAAQTPFFAAFRAGLPAFLGERIQSLLERGRPEDGVRALGLTPDDVDYVAFDHLHTQDLRGLLGTDRATPGEPAPLAALYPRARLLVWRPELEILRALHPLQVPWYLPDATAGVPADRIVVCNGDLLLGKGVALVRTPGHTAGNWSLVLNTAETGMWAVSENGIACDSYAPAASAIPGLRRWARRYGAEVVLNSNTLEMRNEQYTSMVLERELVDRAKDAPEFYQHFSSSELTPTPLTPGLSPTFRHRAITSGAPRASVSRRASSSASPVPAS
jgi:hypothetical protein